MSTLLARRLRVDVTSDLTLASGWLQLNGLTDFDPNISSNIEDATAYDTNGVSSGEVTMVDAAPSATFLSRVASSTRDPGQMLVLGLVGQFGAAARCGMRWYDKNGLAGPDNGSGVFVASVKRAATGAKNLESVTATFGVTDGILNIGISNPYSVATAPVITSVSPSGASAGQSIAIFGAYFTGTVATTGVKIGGTNATSFAVQNDGLITAVVPAGSAGSAPVIVTNATGASAAYPYTRGA